MKEGQVERTKEVLRMISVTVRGWVEEGVISETTIYTWCVLNEPAGWQVGSPILVFEPITKIVFLRARYGMHARMTTILQVTMLSESSGPR